MSDRDMAREQRNIFESTGSSTGKSRPNKIKVCPSKSTQSRSKAKILRSNILLSDSDADSESNRNEPPQQTSHPQLSPDPKTKRVYVDCSLKITKKKASTQQKQYKL